MSGSRHVGIDLTNPAKSHASRTETHAFLMHLTPSRHMAEISHIFPAHKKNNNFNAATTVGSVWIFQFQFASVRFSISSTRFRYSHITAMQEYFSV